MIKFRDYQKDIITKGVKCLLDYRFVYLSMEVRTGKTLTSLGILNKIMSVNGKGAQFDRTVLTSAAMSVGGAVAAWFDRWFQ